MGNQDGALTLQNMALQGQPTLNFSSRGSLLATTRGPKSILRVYVFVLLFFWEAGSTMLPIGFSEGSVNHQGRLRTISLKGALYPTRPSSQSPSGPSRGSVTWLCERHVQVK